MARYGNKQSKGKSWGDNNAKFANISWTAEMDKGYLEWVKKAAPSVDDAISIFIEAGYRVSFSYDDGSDCPKCSVTGSEDAKYNKNIVCTSWGESIEDCLLVSVYKIFTLFPDQNLPTEREKGSTRR